MVKKHGKDWAVNPDKKFDLENMSVDERGKKFWSP